MNEVLCADNLATVSALRHAFFTREWGNAGFAGQQNAAEPRRVREKMAAYLGVTPQNLLTAYQVHSPAVVTVADNWQSNDRPQADALVTGRAGLAIGVLTADCVPVLFADPVARVVGAAHAGWRGAIGGVIENTLQAMENLGAGRNRIHAAIGPCIWQKSYEVGPEFPAPFLAENPGSEKFFKAAFKSGHYLFDLAAYVAARLKSSGVASVENSPADTCAEPARFFSHRYSTLRDEKRAGNLMSAIALL